MYKRKTHLIWHPGALDFEITTADSANDRGEVGLRVNHFYDISCGGDDVRGLTVGPQRAR
jgi:hypothetical protein